MNYIYLIIFLNTHMRIYYKLINNIKLKKKLYLLKIIIITIIYIKKINTFSKSLCTKSSLAYFLV